MASAKGKANRSSGGAGSCTDHGEGNGDPGNLTPKCQGAAAREWMEERQAELLPVPYFHIVSTLPAALGDIAYQNRR
jgi:Transposase zinc-binding domain